MDDIYIGIDEENYEQTLVDLLKRHEQSIRLLESRASDIQKPQPWLASLSKKQMIVLWAGLAIALVMMIVPPWHTSFSRGNSRHEEPAGYSFIFWHPDQGKTGPRGLGVDFGRLLIQLAVVGAATWGGMALAAPKV